jgi:hypothetical protein
MLPVLVMIAFAPSRKVAVQPAGSVSAPKVWSGAALEVVVVRDRARVVDVEREAHGRAGFGVERDDGGRFRAGAGAGAPGSGDVFVTSTLFATIVVRTSVAVAVCECCSPTSRSW